MNAVATIRQPTRLERFVGEVLPSDQREQFYRVLPKHISADRFERALTNVLMNTPDLMACDPRLIFREISKVVGLGLLLDPQLGEAYLILAWNGKTKQKEPQARIGYKGLIKLAKQSGEILNIYAREVHERDEIECVQGDEQRLIHKPKLFTERGKVVGYYAVVKYRNGEIDFEPMSVEQIHEIRDRSDGWKAFKDNKIKSTPWSTDEGEMAKKTVFRRLTKRVSQSPDLNDAIAIEDKAEFPQFGRSQEPPPAPRIAASEPPAAPRTIEHQPSQDTERAGEPSPVEDVEAAGADAPGPQASASDQIDHDEDGVVSKESLLADLDDRLGFTRTAEEVEEAYTDFDAEPILSDYEGGVEAALSLKAKHLDRVPAARPEKANSTVDDTFPGNEAIEKLQGARQELRAGPDPFAIPETFKGGGAYQVRVRDAIKATMAPADEDKLRAFWADTASHRQALAAEGQLVSIDITTLKNEVIAAVDRVRAMASEPDDALPPPAPREPQKPPRVVKEIRAGKAVDAASDDPVAAYTARMEGAFAEARTKEEIDQFWFGTVDERDAIGADEGIRSKWKIARSKAKNALPGEEG